MGVQPADLDDWKDWWGKKEEKVPDANGNGVEEGAGGAEGSQLREVELGSSAEHQPMPLSGAGPHPHRWNIKSL
jgi:hypothetical protein